MDITKQISENNLVLSSSSLVLNRTIPRLRGRVKDEGGPMNVASPAIEHGLGRVRGNDSCNFFLPQEEEGEYQEAVHTV